jgi:predicted ribosome quality control (RQC) complex YloA/Tae2 family protein
MWFLMLMLTSLTRRGGRAFVATPPRRCVSRVARGAAADGVDPLDVRRTALVAAIDAALTKEARKAEALRKEAKAAADAEAMAHRANLIFSNLYRIKDDDVKIAVEDWENGGEVVEITLSPKFRSAKDEADAGFKKARRLRRGSAVVEELLEASSAKSTVLEGLRGDAVDADGDALEMLEKRAAKKGATVVEVEALPKTPVEKKKKSTWTGRTFTSPAGVPILVGRSRKENDRLSLVIARDGDYWLHARNAPGAHVLLQLSRAPRYYSEPEPDCLQMAADLAAFYSDLRNEARADVTYTSPKHVTKPPRAPPGAVRLREELGTHVGRPDQVPDECKEKRGESGQVASW